MNATTIIRPFLDKVLDSAYDRVNKTIIDAFTGVEDVIAGVLDEIDNILDKKSAPEECDPEISIGYFKDEV